MYVNGVLVSSNSDFKAVARQQLTNNWLQAVIVCFIYSAIMSAAGSIAGIGALIVGGPLTFGLCVYFINLQKSENAEIENLFVGFRHFENSLILYLLTALFTFLWSLLFIIPGIIAALSYSMSFYILADNPNLSGMEALEKSKQMMQGHKGRLFCLFLSFIGWFILSMLTFGIGFLFLYPYIQASVVNFYTDLKTRNY